MFGFKAMGFKAPLRNSAVFVFAGFSIVALWHWQLWIQLPSILARDTLWHLSPGARVILVALATCAVVATALCCLVKSIWVKQHLYIGQTFQTKRWIGLLALDLTTTFLLLWGAISLAPQLFYLLYVTVIPGLPMQWVANLIDWNVLLNFLTPTPADSMATLLIGVMMLSILVASIIFWLSILVNLVKTKQ